MQSHEAYYENGQIVLVGNPQIPEGSRIIITVLDESFIGKQKTIEPRQITVANTLNYPLVGAGSRKTD